MAADMFLKITGIKGESTDDKHKGEIEIESFTFGVSNTGTAGRGGGMGAGKASFQDISFSKRADAASPILMQKCATGDHIDKALLTVRKAGGGQQEYYKIILSDLMISSFSNGGSYGDSVPSESLSLNFGKIEFEYYTQNKDGSLGSPTKVGYDMEANKKF